MQAQPWETLVDLDSLAAHSVLRATHRSLRNLVEMCALATFMSGRTRRVPPDQYAQLPYRSALFPGHMQAAAHTTRARPRQANFGLSRGRA